MEKVCPYCGQSPCDLSRNACPMWNATHLLAKMGKELKRRQDEWKRTRRTVLILAAVIILSAPVAAGQRANAYLERIARADVDGRVMASTESGIVTVCLDTGGTYVLALDRAASSRAAGAIVRDENQQQEVFLSLGERSERRWTWTSFRIAGPRCVHVAATGGLARLYRLTVGVSW